MVVVVVVVVFMIVMNQIVCNIIVYKATQESSQSRLHLKVLPVISSCVCVITCI